jgi:hypothetical protein
MRDEALASGKDRSTPIPDIPLRFEIVVTARLPAAIFPPGYATGNAVGVGN